MIYKQFNKYNPLHNLDAYNNNDDESMFVITNFRNK